MLDTCEHLAESCAALIDSLLRGAPRLRVLATSRQPLGVQGEQVFPLPPLSVADAAVPLFVERARASMPTFALVQTNQDAVERLCRGLDGIPLAIELAAVRTRALPVQQIADLLDDRFALLSRGGAGVAGRHESLRTAIDWSYALCTRAEGLLWARVSIFAGDFDLAAAPQICSDDELAGADIRQLIAGLVDKSILLCERHAAGVTYRLLDTIREYGLELLRQTGEEHRLRRRHRDFYRQLVRRFDAEWCGPEQVIWCARLSREHSNIRAALDFSLSDPAEHEAGLDMAGALVFFWIACGHCREGRQYLDWALSLDHAPGPPLTKALWVCAWVAANQGDEKATEARLAQCRPLAAAQGDTAASGWIAYVASANATLHGDPVRALALAEESADLHRNGGDPGAGPLAALAAQSIALDRRRVRPRRRHRRENPGPERGVRRGVDALVPRLPARPRRDRPRRPRRRRPVRPGRVALQTAAGRQRGLGNGGRRAGPVRVSCTRRHGSGVCSTTMLPLLTSAITDGFATNTPVSSKYSWRSNRSESVRRPIFARPWCLR